MVAYFLCTYITILILASGTTYFKISNKAYLKQNIYSKKGLKFSQPIKLF